LRLLAVLVVMLALVGAFTIGYQFGSERQFDKDEQAAQEIVRCVTDGRNGCGGATTFFDGKP
jgi:hypothetical protein